MQHKDYLHNAHGDVTNTQSMDGLSGRSYQYDAFGNEKNPSSVDMNPFRYCGEYWDSETETYYLRARYYDPKLGRFLTADTHWNVANMIYGDDPVQLNGKNVPNYAAYTQSLNLYTYCGSNPVMWIDPTGQAWWHWVIVGGLVVAAAVATVVTAGGATAALVAVGSVASGMAAATTASTVAAGALIGTSVVAGGALLMADYTSIQTFNNSANWGTVGATFAGGLMGGTYGFKLGSSSNSSQAVLKTADVAKKVANADRVGTALAKTDAYHRAGSFLTESQLANGTAKYITGGDGIQRILLQVEGSIDGVKGVFEYILQSDGTVSHQLFTPY